MFAQLQTRFARWRLYRHTLNELNLLDRHILHDIGFERTTVSDLRQCARAGAAEAVK